MNGWKEKPSMRSVAKIVKHIICYLSYYYNINDYTLQMDVYDFVQELKHRSANSSKSDPWSSSQLLTSQPPQHNYFALSKYFIINNCFHLYYSSLNVYWINPNLSMHTYRVKVVFINQLFCKLLIIKYINFYSCDRKICFTNSR